MNLLWLKDKEKQKYFKIFWEKESGNGGDYFTNDPTIHHKAQRGRYVRDTLNMLSQNITSIYNKELQNHILTS